MKKAILFMLLLVICSCGQVTVMSGQSWFNSGIKGNGVVKTEKRTVKNFDKVFVSGSFDVVLTDGKEGQISIEGEENIIPYIETIVSGNFLRIKFKDNISVSYTKKLIVTVAFEDINEITLTGSGDVITEKTVSADDVKVNLTGSGNMKIKVKSQNFKSVLTGSGDIKILGETENYNCVVTGSGVTKAYQLQSKNTKAIVSGSGDIKATATHKIKAVVSGSGDIRYRGNPEFVDTKVTGSGDIKSK